MALLAAAVLGMARAADAADPSTDPPPPQGLSSVGDILGGKRHLLRVDDLALVAIDNGLVEAFTNATSNSATGTTSFVGAVAVSNLNPAFSSPAGRAGDIAPHVLGRMVNLDHDVLVSLLLGANGQWILFVNPLTAPGVSATVTTGIAPASGGASQQTVVVADFDGDGYVEALIAYLGQNAQGQTAGAMRIVKPVDVNDLSKGVTFGPEVMTTPDIGLPFSTLTTGDVNGDGIPEILSFNGQSLSVSTVNPKTFEITIAAARVSLGGVLVFPFNLIAGRFRNATNDDVMIVGQADGGVNGVTVYPVFGSSSQPSGDSSFQLTLGVSQLVIAGGDEGVLHVFVAKGPLPNQFANTDLLVVGAALNTHALGTIVSVDPASSALDNLPNPIDLMAGGPGSHGCLYGLSVGAFDNGPPPPGQTTLPMQVATLWRPLLLLNGDCTDGGVQLFPFVRFWNVTLDEAGDVTGLSALPDSEPLGQALPSTGLLLRVGDVQGRSLVLGAPEKVTIQGNVQPDIVLGIPPMHIDWINPVVSTLPPAQYPGCNRPPRPCQINVSAFPSVPPLVGASFATAYDFSGTATNQGARKSTTSWSLGVKVSSETKFTVGVPDVEAVSVDIKNSAGFTHEGTVSHEYNTYAGTSDTISATSGFGDQVFFTQRQQNIYYYPIIGKSACPAGERCPPTAPQPLYVAFSGPSEVVHNEADATTIDWYQPVHEPGNLFSYPWSLAQLQSAFAPMLQPSAADPLVPLTTNPALLQATDTSQKRYSTTWTGTTGETSSTGSVNAQSASLSISVSGVTTDEAGQISASSEFDLNQSASVSTLNTSTQTLAASTGIVVTTPEFPSPTANTFLYEFGAYVLGTSNPNATLQNIPLSDGSGQPIDLQTTGPLIVGFVADPVTPGLPWWRQAYTLPDVGLNHPARWDWSKSTQTATFNAPNATDPPQDQAFYHMKGLFIMPADATTGPARTSATAGDQLRLTARVHNYSLVDTTAPVHVRFYGQVIDSTTRVLDGPAFQIGTDQQIASIPGFMSSPTGDPNWALASVNLDTTPYPDTDLVFWAVVWMQNAAGKMMPELPAHGLTANPASLTFAQITDVPVESHSNNVGMFGVTTPFQVFPKPTSPTAPSPPGQLAVVGVFPDGPVIVDRRAKIIAELRAVGGERLGVPVAFYDGDPDLGGKLFAFHTIPRLRADQPHRVRAFLRAETCGAHTVVVVAGAESGRATNRVEVQVTADSSSAIAALIASVRRLDVARQTTSRLVAELEAAGKAFRKGEDVEGSQHIAAFQQMVSDQSGHDLTPAQAAGLLGQAEQLQSCLAEAGVTAAITALEGDASRVGEGTGRGSVKITGRLAFTPSRVTLDLSNATVTLASVLREIDGAGELVDRVAAGHVQLVAPPGQRSDSAVFELPGSDRPSISLQITARSPGIADFRLTIDRAVLSREPERCGAGSPASTVLETSFAIDDGQHEPVEATLARPWQCVGRSPRPGSQLRAR